MVPLKKRKGNKLKIILLGIQLIFWIEIVGLDLVREPHMW
jgi:hypothetical protein